MVTAIATCQVNRTLHDGSSYTMTSEPGALSVITVRDHTDDVAVVTMDRSQVRQFVEDLELVAGLKPTAPVLGLGGALASSARILFERLEQLDRIEPSAAASIRRTMLNHLRSSAPMLLTEVP